MNSKILGILSALTASICCIGPLLLILLGLGGLGLGAVVGKYHWYFILGATLFLVFAWINFFKEKKSCEIKACTMEDKKMTKNILIFASVVVMTFAGLNLYTYTKASPTIEATHAGVQVLIPVKGMTCFTCEAAVKSAVNKLDGINRVEASAKDQNALVSYNPKKTSLTQIVDAINQTGFKAEKQKS